MIEVLQNKHSNANIALKLSHYKKKGYTIVGVGYPFFSNELKSIIDLCDWFVDDMNNPMTIRWTSRFEIKDINALTGIDNFVIVVLSNNRNRVLSQLLNMFSNIPIFKIFADDLENNTTLQDVELSSFLTYRSYNKKNLHIHDSINVNGNCTILQKSGGTITVGSLTLFEGALIKNNSRNNLIIDSLIMQKNAILTMNLDSSVNIRNCYVGKDSKIYVYSGTITIEDVYFGDNCTIHVYDKLHIGSGSIVSWNASILDGDGHTLDHNNEPRGIYIGNNVWVGNGAIILKGVSIGEGSMIGAGSVVTHSVPPHSLVAGNPARIIRTNIEWEYSYAYQSKKNYN